MKITPTKGRIMIMNRKEQEIYRNLKASEDFAYVDHAENQIYLALDNGLLILSPVDQVSEMTSEEINQFIQESLQQLMK